MSIINVYAAILISFNFIIKSGDASAEWAMCWSSGSQIFFKIGVLQKFENFTKKHLGVSF